METMTFKKKEIYFNKHNYEVYLNQWNKKTELRKSIEFELKKFFPAMKINVQDLFPNPEVKIYDLVEKQYKQNNPMGLSGIKLAELKELDFRSLLNNQIFNYEKLKDLKKPTKSDFTSYAVSHAEIEKLNQCKDFIRSLNSLSGKENYLMPEQNQIIHLTNRAITIGVNSDLIPSKEFIKNAI
tara:strand:- start:234 stop:782 length:549 start_codon:yes stop_codon:yes gene_type:complete